MQETWIRSLSGEDPLEEEKAIHSSVLAWESHGQRSLAGYGPGGLVLGRWRQQQEQRCLEGALSPLGHSRSPHGLI